jgi:nicotinamide-nucleotide amidase
MIETFAQGLPEDIHDLATGLMHAICERRGRLATAESCTGGLIAAVLTDVEGCAHGFDRGFVCYTDDAKRDQLGVPAAILKEATAVSAPAANAMAEGALAASAADIALAVTGFAGPGAPGEENGLVYFAIARRDHPAEVIERHFGAGSRAEIRLACLRTGLRLLSERVTAVAIAEVR